MSNINMVLDSGAFSADQKGTEVDVYKYMDFIRENKVELYFNEQRSSFENPSQESYDDSASVPDVF